MKPICVPCERFMRPKRNGIAFIEGMPHSGNEPWDGKIGKGSTGWTPYKLWYGDLWLCPTCGSQIIVGVGAQPVAEHYEPDFKRMLEAIKPTLLVKDC